MHVQKLHIPGNVQRENFEEVTAIIFLDIFSQKFQGILFKLYQTQFKLEALDFFMRTDVLKTAC